jgi:hypothetical protein
MSAALQIAPIGFAIPLPAMSGAEPCTGSNMPMCAPAPGEMFALAHTPSPPWIAPARSVRMSPNKLEATTTSSESGLRTMRAASASTSTFSRSTSGNFAPTSSTTSSQSTIVWRSAFDFVALVSSFRRARACSNAYRTMRSIPARVKTDVSTATSPTRPPAPEYSPSTFSRTKSMSTSSGPRPASGHGTPGSRRTGRTFAHRPSPLRSASKSPHSVTSSGTDGWPTAPSRIASNPRATATPSLGIIAPCSCQ